MSTILVNNAGIFPFGATHEMSEEVVRRGLCAQT